MATSYRIPFAVLSRTPGAWLDGRYYPERAGTTRNVAMTIQEPSTGDNNAIDALQGGRRAARYIKIYSDERLNAVSQQPGGNPGDLVIFQGRQFLIIGEANFTMLQRTRPATPVSHWRYYAAEVIETDTTEAVP